ncbi:MAG: DEAD/DEAH box helicase [Candidatus Micrarchaeia archaeon]
MSHLIIKKFGSLTEIQKQAIPLVQQGKNVLIIAPTGSGKTETAAVPIMERIKESNLKGIAAIYITPLRALNRDMLKRLTEWAKEIGITIAVRHGDTGTSERSLQAKSPPQFLITTPETLQAILPAKKIGEHLRNVKYVIVDELHELADSKRGAQLSIGLERLAEKAGEFQRIGISATVSDPIKLSQFLCGFRSCEIVDLKYLKSMKFEISYPQPVIQHEKEANELQIDSAAVARLKEIQKIIQHQRTLIFVNTRSIAEILGSRLMKLDPKIAVHHGSLSKEVRIQLEDDFKNGKLHALVATSSLELGIDIGDISHVIQYMSPRQVSRLVQRVGRSGHTIKGTSKGTIICADPDDIFEAHALLKLIEEGQLEEQHICENALDVLAHQIAGILVERDKEVSTEEVYSIIKRAYPYSTLHPEKFLSVINFMEDKRLLKKNGNMLQRMSSTRLYYYEHLSTIPSVEKFLVKDAATNKIISTLDEDFVSFFETNELFITKGVPWRILDIDNERRIVVVEAADDISAAIPDWEGEEIPTSYEVAQTVGKLRTTIKELLKESEDINKAAKETGIEAEAIKDLIDSPEFRETMPINKNILIECWNDVAVIHVLGGLNANRTLAAVLAERLSKEYGSSIKTLVDAYRIALILPRKAESNVVKDQLLAIARSDIKSDLESHLSKHKLFRFKFIHIGKMFNLFRETPRISDRFIQAFVGTPVYEETLRDVYSSYYDLKNAQKILDGIAKKEISVHSVHVKKLSPVATRALIRNHGSELIASIEPTSEIIKAFKAKLLGKSVVLYCMHCGKDWISFIGTLQEKVKCPKCGSSVVTILPNFVSVEDVRKLLKKKRLNSEEKSWREKLERSAAIISASGRNGVITLSTYGIGPTKASSILSRPYKNEDEFYAALLEAQKTFIRTKRFWEFH